jgi:hypothetical protein
METILSSLPASVEAIGRISVSDWQTYVEIQFGEDLPHQVIEALQNGESLTVTFQVIPQGMQSQWDSMAADNGSREGQICSDAMPSERPKQQRVFFPSRGIHNGVTH